MIDFKCDLGFFAGELIEEECMWLQITLNLLKIPQFHNDFVHFPVSFTVCLLYLACSTKLKPSAIGETTSALLSGLAVQYKYPSYLTILPPQ